ncbi:MAG: hypothetical protein AAF645_25625, partial [Myxococcota bacterium]
IAEGPAHYDAMAPGSALHPRAEVLSKGVASLDVGADAALLDEARVVAERTARRTHGSSRGTR